MGAIAAALVALVLMSYASTQSNMMQMTMASAVAQPMCGGSVDPDLAAMDSMASGPSKASSAVTPKGHAPAKACPYCAAAAHSPILQSALPWRAPSSVAFAAFRVVASHGPRGPPVCQPRARGPPSHPLSA